MDAGGGRLVRGDSHPARDASPSRSIQRKNAALASAAAIRRYRHLLGVGGASSATRDRVGGGCSPPGAKLGASHDGRHVAQAAPSTRRLLPNPTDVGRHEPKSGTVESEAPPRHPRFARPPISRRFGDARGAHDSLSLGRSVASPCPLVRGRLPVLDAARAKPGGTTCSSSRKRACARLPRHAHGPFAAAHARWPRGNAYRAGGPA